MFIASFERDSDWQPSPWHQRDYEFDAPRQEDQP
ncbi:MAG: multicomponent Na+:H+ antiporter subunit E [Rhodococcus sp. (in: high G+C Gram-positive bacteria)]